MPKRAAEWVQSPHDDGFAVAELIEHCVKGWPVSEFAVGFVDEDAWLRLRGWQAPSVLS